MLLREAGYDFIQADPPFADSPTPLPHEQGQQPADLALAIARKKAESFPADLWKNCLLLAADTLIVHADGQVAGTPVSAAEARVMLQRFVRGSHTVISAVALRLIEADGRELELLTFADCAQVHWGEVSEQQIEQYLTTNHWQGKAGGYNLFERQDDHWPITVTGDETTVVGLPMKLVISRLSNTRPII